MRDLNQSLPHALSYKKKEDKRALECSAELFLVTICLLGMVE
jgi:hypothetical protein